MNLHFASFDFAGQADIQVTINEKDYHRRAGKTYPKAEELWKGNAIVRPLSRGIQPKTEGRKGDVLHHQARPIIHRTSRHGWI